MKTCTWQGCAVEAKHPLVSQDQGDVYAELCDGHKAVFDRAVAEAGPHQSAPLLAAWISAQGGRVNAERRRVKRAFAAKVRA